MKGAKIITNAEVLTAATPDSGYRSLYPKEDGWYAKDSEGNESKISSIVINGNSEDKIEFGSGFRVEVINDILYIDLAYGDEDTDADWPTHGNEAHIIDFASQSDVDNAIASYNDSIFQFFHVQNTDSYLDYGGVNQVSAASIKALVDANAGIQQRGVVRTGDAETNVTNLNEFYISHTSGNNVSFVLPPASENKNIPFTFRHGGGNYAMTVERSGMNIINYDGVEVEGLTTTESGAWVSVISDGIKWYVTMSSGLIEDINA